MAATSNAITFRAMAARTYRGPTSSTTFRTPACIAPMGTADTAAITDTLPPITTTRAITDGLTIRGRHRHLTLGVGPGSLGTDTTGHTTNRIRFIPRQRFG